MADEGLKDLAEGECSTISMRRRAPCSGVAMAHGAGSC